ncbi:MAG TPA: hypothetical protein VI588_00840 [Candidatus Gracilibacteria bacterium]|nr:hypothetical protein [Candidatus Gracilibacteria bacterium]
MNTRHFTFVLVMGLMLLAVSGCQAQPADQSGKQILETPYSTGPTEPPSVKGPTTPPPISNGNGQPPQAVTESSTVQYTLPTDAETEFKN